MASVHILPLSWVTYRSRGYQGSLTSPDEWRQASEEMQPGARVGSFIFKNRVKYF